MPAIISSTIVPRTCSVSSLRPSEFRVQQEASEVVPLVLPVVGDLFVEIVFHLVLINDRLALVVRGSHVFQDEPYEAAEAVGVLLWEAEHVDHHPQRDVLDVLDGGVKCVASGSDVPAVRGTPDG